MSSHEDYANERAKVLLSCYRTVSANDVSKYIMTLGIVLALFPEATIAEATSPKTGIATKLIWPPSAAELKAYCEELVARRHEAPPAGFQPKPYSNYYPHPDQFAPSEADRARVAAALARYKGALKPMEEPKRPPWQPPTDEQLYAHYGRRQPAEEPVPFD